MPAIAAGIVVLALGAAATIGISRASNTAEKAKSSEGEVLVALESKLDLPKPYERNVVDPGCYDSTPGPGASVRYCEYKIVIGYDNPDAYEEITAKLDALQPTSKTEQDVVGSGQGKQTLYKLLQVNELICANVTQKTAVSGRYAGQEISTLVIMHESDDQCEF